MEYATFYVGKRPQVAWAWDLAQRNLEFLQGIDVDYFLHIAEIEGQLLGTDRCQYAAASVRIAYGQALETFFALVSAAMQAPGCVVGWMLVYRNDELREVVKAISVASTSRRLSSGAPAKLQPFGAFADCVMTATQWDAEKREHLARAFGTLWSGWAREFLDERATSEYNAFKHGMRSSLGGFSLSIGTEEQPGVAPAPESMRTIGASEFGSTFFTTEDIDGRLHMYPRRTSRNWNALAMVHSLQLLAMSIQNVVSYLRVVNGDDPQVCRFTAPSDHKSFELPWLESRGVTFTNMDLIVRKEHIESWTKEQVRARIHRESSFTARDGTD